jgi:hypothetical protein
VLLGRENVSNAYPDRDSASETCVGDVSSPTGIHGNDDSFVQGIGLSCAYISWLESKTDDRHCEWSKSGEVFIGFNPRCEKLRQAAVLSNSRDDARSPKRA